MPAGAGVLCGGSRQAAADLIDGDDEILVGIERGARGRYTPCSQILCVPEYQVGIRMAFVAGAVERAVGRVGELAATDRAAFLQLEIADVVQLIGAVDILRVVAVVDHAASLRVPERAAGEPPLLHAQASSKPS